MSIARALCLSVLPALVLAACAVSPQTVALTPRLDVASPAIGRGRALVLEVVDVRPHVHFGSRGGVYDTALIAPRTDVAAAVRDALAERLVASQFQIVEAGADGAPALRVEIQRIDYRLDQRTVPAQVSTAARVRAVARNGATTLAGQYESSRSLQVLTLPDEARNEALLEAAVARALERILQDPAILDLLSR